MNYPSDRKFQRRLWTALLAVELAASGSLIAQTSPAPAAVGAADEPVVLSPFVVSTEKDNGYKATNATTGTRLNESIKDLPMPISVVTEKFLRDTGATDLRQALSYTSAIQLRSQNDQGTPGGAYQGPGGVNNPEGATANLSQTSYKIRGYVTDAVLRDGFRRQHATDSIDIGRVEVAFGPTALLYGIGEFGGIVNYVPKLPQAKRFSEIAATYGSYDFKRLTVDTTGPISDTWKFNYRLTGALQDTHDYTDYRKENHSFISPAVSFQPTKTTTVLIDYEYGKQTDKGVGFQRVRAMTGVSGGDQGEHADFYTVPGTDPYSFRWSGPDTYVKTKSSNLRAQVDQALGEHIHLLVGYNFAKAKFDQRDVFGNLVTGLGPLSLRKTVNFGTAALDKTGGDSNLNVVNGTVNDVALSYGWNNIKTSNAHDQVRAELTGNLKVLEKSKWLAFNNSLLIGHSEEKQTNISDARGTANGVSNYKSPLDTSPIRFGTQGDGTADVAMINKTYSRTLAWDQATYVVYSGKFIQDRVMLILGGRDDYSDNFVYSNDRMGNTPTSVRSPKVKVRTYQRGISVQLTPSISAFALKAEGVQPNFSGNLDTNGTPMGPVVAKSTEYGVKFDLWHGRISGSISSFKINRSGTPFFYWWAPTSNYHHFNTSKDIVYQINEFAPQIYGGPSWTNGAGDASVAKFEAAKTDGAIYQKTVSGNTNWYVDASKATGAAFLDSVFDFTKAHGMSWPGWLYNTDAETNNSWDDRASSPQGNEYVSGSDQSKGWSADVVFTPSNELQIIASYTHINKIITSAGNFAKSPNPQDRWAVWYFPNTDWGLTGKPITTAYRDPLDTSTWTGVGFGYGEKQDDTPEHQASLWANYQFAKDSALKGWTFGLGGGYESPREYQSGITHGGGQRITDKNGNIVILKTPERYVANAMIRYSFKMYEHDASVQLNVGNIFDDRKLYGLIYSSPRQFRLEFAYKF
jgi:outer membrane receptor for ferric coprogen and ferric-rhodotorulic acid